MPGLAASPPLAAARTQPAPPNPGRGSCRSRGRPPRASVSHRPCCSGPFSSVRTRPGGRRPPSARRRESRTPPRHARRSGITNRALGPDHASRGGSVLASAEADLPVPGQSAGIQRFQAAVDTPRCSPPGWLRLHRVAERGQRQDALRWRVQRGVTCLTWMVGPRVAERASSRGAASRARRQGPERYAATRSRRR